MPNKCHIPLVKSRSSIHRYYLIKDGRGMGGAGHPANHYLNQWVVANGQDRGNGYQRYMSVDYALSGSSLPEYAKTKIRQTLRIKTIDLAKLADGIENAIKMDTLHAMPQFADVPMESRKDVALATVAAYREQLKRNEQEDI